MKIVPMRWLPKKLRAIKYQHMEGSKSDIRRKK